MLLCVLSSLERRRKQQTRKNTREKSGGGDKSAQTDSTVCDLSASVHSVKPGQGRSFVFSNKNDGCTHHAPRSHTHLVFSLISLSPFPRSLISVPRAPPILPLVAAPRRIYTAPIFDRAQPPVDFISRRPHNPATPSDWLLLPAAFSRATSAGPPPPVVAARFLADVDGRVFAFLAVLGCEQALSRRGLLLVCTCMRDKDGGGDAHAKAFNIQVPNSRDS